MDCCSIPVQWIVATPTHTVCLYIHIGQLHDRQCQKERKEERGTQTRLAVVDGSLQWRCRLLHLLLGPFAGLQELGLDPGQDAFAHLLLHELEPVGGGVHLVGGEALGGGLGVGPKERVVGEVPEPHDAGVEAGKVKHAGGLGVQPDL